jgi:hypothetical protein
MLKKKAFPDLFLMPVHNKQEEVTQVRTGASLWELKSDT